MSNDSPFLILTVCTGNICRSPVAERLLQADLNAMAPGEFTVTSARTGALIGSAMDARAAELVIKFGGVPHGFIARQLSAQVLAGPDLVLTMTREHRGRVVELCPALLRKAFTLREFARLLPMVGWRRSRVTCRTMAGRRDPGPPPAHRNPAGADKDDVADPFRRSDEVYGRMAAELTPTRTVDSVRRFH